MDSPTYFVDVLLPLPIPGRFTYRLPKGAEVEIHIGQRVIVPFGAHKHYAAIVVDIHQNVPQYRSVKYVLANLDAQPIVTPWQLKFWQWLADYYMCTLGEVMAAALPSALKLSGETKVVLNIDFDGDVTALTEPEQAVIEALTYRPELTVDDISKLTGLAKTINLIKTMRDKAIILTKDEVQDRFRPKMEAFYRLAPQYDDDKTLSELFDQLEKRAAKQVEVLMIFVDHCRREHCDEIRRADFLPALKGRETALQALIKKSIIISQSKVISRIEHHHATAQMDTLKLSEAQQTAMEEILESWTTKDVVLLHGVTSSGKTEIYTQLIDRVRQRGQTILYLLPEIALTSQIIHRLRKYFGDDVLVYHSRFSEQERAEVWARVLDSKDKPVIVLGARSALFLPFDNLGLVIVDEEHESTFKQYDPAPRYHARDSAIAMAYLHKAKVLLGSATPSIESYFNAQNGKYGLVSLTTRFGGLQLPELILANLRQEKETNKGYFSKALLDEIQTALDQKEQVILFQNRRGYAIRLECDVCHFMPECPNCDVTLTYHKHSHRLLCHYCGHSESLPSRCPQCQSPLLTMKGFGTEKVEDDLALIFPQARIQRMDLDTTRSKHAYRKIIEDFEQHEVDILIGTQMVTKGLDFENVSLVGILNADNMLGFPDFRAYERSFQLMTQVSGRAGRKHKQGRVIIQTNQPKHPILDYVVRNDYISLYQEQLQDRQTFLYPPYYRLIRVTLKHKDAQLLQEAARFLGEGLKAQFGSLVLGPNLPLVARVQTYYLREFIIKMDRFSSIKEPRASLHRCIEALVLDRAYKTVKVVLDVDPI